MKDFWSNSLGQNITEKTLSQLSPQQHVDLKAELQYQIAVLQLLLSQVRLSYYDALKTDAHHP